MYLHSLGVTVFREGGIVTVENEEKNPTRVWKRG